MPSPKPSKPARPETAGSDLQGRASGLRPALDAASKAAPPAGRYAEHRARLLAAYAEDRASRPVGSTAKFGTVEAAASRLVQLRCWDTAKEVAALPARDLDDLAAAALATAILWEVNDPADSHEVAAVALIRAALSLTGTPLPEGFAGFGDEPDCAKRDRTIHHASGSLPAWALAKASADTDDA